MAREQLSFSSNKSVWRLLVSMALLMAMASAGPLQRRSVASADDLEQRFSQLVQPMISSRIFPTKTQRLQAPEFHPSPCGPECNATISASLESPLEERSSCPFRFNTNVDPTRYPHTLFTAVCCKGPCSSFGNGRGSSTNQARHCQPLMQTVKVLRKVDLHDLRVNEGDYREDEESVPVACLCVPKDPPSSSSSQH